MGSPSYTRHVGQPAQSAVDSHHHRATVHNTIESLNTDIIYTILSQQKNSNFHAYARENIM